LRPESAADADYVRTLSESLALPCTIGISTTSLEAAPGSLEENARVARYRFLADVAQEVQASYVATAHTADDQVETVLYSIVRGTGIHGLGGIPACRDLNAQVQIIRPLLHVRRSEIEAYLDAIGIVARQDETNRDPRFTRNRVRHELLPMLRERFNPRTDEAILRLAEQAQSAAMIVDRFANDLLQSAILESSDIQVTLSLDAVRNVEPFILRAAIRHFMEQQGWPRQQLGHAELKRISEVSNPLGPKAWELPGGLRVERLNKPIPAIRLTRQAPTSQPEQMPVP
jgi:tRNA(Ile)-lysidine synthase